LKVYSETLIRKLEEKTLQLQEANRNLEKDIAERERTAENLRESEERFRGTFEQAAVGIAHVALDGQFLRVNDKLCEMTGYSREELMRMSFFHLTLTEDRPRSEEARRSMVSGQTTSYSVEKRYQRKSGDIFWVNVVTSLLRGEDQSPK